MLRIFIFNIILQSLIYKTFGNKCLVKVEQGVLLGKLDTTVIGNSQYCSFKGIPYAQPPVGNLRFKAPLAALKWKGVKNASEHGSVCPQINRITNGYSAGNEDCLFLNVYSRSLVSKTSTLRSVLFFIHGGGFTAGSGDVDQFGPDFFVRDGYDLVVVTINYRLGPLGFLCLDTKDVPGNAGLKDQVMALKWVQANIKEFGGDPTKVTIMGHSAGGCSVAMHLCSRMSAGLFQRGMALSGGPYNDWAFPYRSVQRAFNLGKLLGCETHNTDVLLSCLQNATSGELVNAEPYVLASEEVTGTLNNFGQFVPVVEKYSGKNNFLTEDLLGGDFSYVNRADVLFGFTSHEGLSTTPMLASTLLPIYNSYVEIFTPRKVCVNVLPFKCLDNGANVQDYYFGNRSVSNDTIKELVEYITEGNYQYDIIRFFSLLPNKGSKYMYQFSSLTERNYYGSRYSKPYGICDPGPCPGHGDDLYSLFDPKVQHYSLAKNSIDLKVINTYTTIVKNFVNYGNPSPKGSLFNVTWPEFNCSTMQYINIGTPDLEIESIKALYTTLDDLFSDNDIL